MSERENKYLVRCGNFIDDAETIIDSEGNVLLIDKDAFITLPTPEEIIANGAIEIILPTIQT